MTNSTWAVSGTITYEGFGQTIATSGSSTDPYEFGASSGYRTDGDAGLMQVWSITMDPLEEAHLNLIRGDPRRARIILEAILKENPSDNAALRMLSEVESTDFQQRTQRAEQSSWLADFEPSTPSLIVLIIIASVFFLAGLSMLADAVALGLKRGFSTQVVMHFGKGPLTGHYPVHLLLATPLLLIVGCGFVLISVYRYLRSQ